MSHLMNMRKAYKEDFEKKHGIKLGFMSCFVKASADALREMPAVNGCELSLTAIQVVRAVSMWLSFFPVCAFGGDWSREASGGLEAFSLTGTVRWRFGPK